MVAMIGTGGQQLSGGGANQLGDASGNALGIGGGGGIMDLLGNNPALLGALGAGAGGILGKLLGGGNDLPYKDELGGSARGLGSEAGQLYNTGIGLIDPLVSGKLPPGAEQSVQNAIKQAQTTVKGRYGSLGQTGSTMEGDALSNIENQATQMRFQIAEDMAKTGLAATGQSIQALGLQASIYEKMMEAQMKQDQGMSDMIGKMAAAVGQGIGLAAKVGVLA